MYLTLQAEKTLEKDCTRKYFFFITYSHSAFQFLYKIEFQLLLQLNLSLGSSTFSFFFRKLLPPARATITPRLPSVIAIKHYIP